MAARAPGAVAYGLVCLELEVGGQQLAHLRLGSGLAGDDGDPPARLGGAEGRVAAAHGPRRGDRMLLPHRAERRQRPRRHADDRATRRRRLDPRRHQALDRTRQRRRPRRRLGEGCGRRRRARVPRAHRRRPGSRRPRSRGKLSMRASIQCDVVLEGVRVPESAMLPGARGLSGPFACLNEARYGIAWGAMGAARSCLEAAIERGAQPRGVRAPDRKQAAHPGAARRHVRRVREGRAARPAPGPAEGARRAHSGADQRRQAQQRARGAADRAARPGRSSGATGSRARSP